MTSCIHKLHCFAWNRDSHILIDFSWKPHLPRLSFAQLHQPWQWLLWLQILGAPHKPPSFPKTLAVAAQIATSAWFTGASWVFPSVGNVPILREFESELLNIFWCQQLWWSKSKPFLRKPSKKPHFVGHLLGLETSRPRSTLWKTSPSILTLPFLRKIANFVQFFRKCCENWRWTKFSHMT